MKEIRNIYNAAVSFDMPMEGVVPIAAKDIEEAKAVLEKLFANRRNLVVHDIYDIDDAPGIEDQMDKDENDNIRTLN